ncbi:uncharacterized protein LOC127848316 isoform X1 [Dreissena polymorpha]|nr:uncharacterized protein LOC127848316 isoform X1 [Dreissena polymorpha]
MVTKQCVKCPIRQYNNKTGENINLCKICPAGKTNAKTGQPDCPLTVTSPFERKFVNIMIKLKYKLAIDDCNMSPDIVVSFRTAIGKALRDLFLFNKNNRYNGDYSFCRGDCENIIVDEDLKSCFKVSSVRRKREFDHELLFTVTFNNVSTQIPDPKDGNVELLTSDVIAQILLFNQGSLTPESQARVMQYQSNTGLTAVGICGDGTSWVDPQCVLCQAGSAGTSGNCLQCGPDTYQDAAGQTTCKPCPENTFHNVNGAANNKSCEDFCTKNPLYCNNGGRCVTTGRRTAMCNCYDDNEGDRCQSKKEPQSTLPVILGAAIGGGGGLLVLILVMVGLYKCLSTKGPRSEKRYAPEHMDYDNYGPVFYDNPVGSLGRIPAIGYPTAGHQIKETSFDHGSQNGAYQWSSHEGRAGWDMYEGQGPQTRWET